MSDSGRKTATKPKAKSKDDSEAKKKREEEILKRRKEAIEAKVRKKLECQKKALKIVERLLDNPITQEFLEDASQFLDQHHYKDVAEERAIAKMCGYPLCQNTLGPIPKQKYHISSMHNKLYDISERKNFCCNYCYKASKYFEKQVSTSPVWCRDQEPRVHFKFLDRTDAKTGGAGEEILVNPRDALKKDLEDLNQLDRHGGKFAQPLKVAIGTENTPHEREETSCRVDGKVGSKPGIDNASVRDGSIESEKVNDIVSSRKETEESPEVEGESSKVVGALLEGGKMRKSVTFCKELEGSPEVKGESSNVSGALLEGEKMENLVSSIKELEVKDESTMVTSGEGFESNKDRVHETDIAKNVQGGDESNLRPKSNTNAKDGDNTDQSRNQVSLESDVDGKNVKFDEMDKSTLGAGASSLDENPSKEDGKLDHLIKLMDRREFLLAQLKEREEILKQQEKTEREIMLRRIKEKSEKYQNTKTHSISDSDESPKGDAMSNENLVDDRPGDKGKEFATESLEKDIVKLSLKDTSTHVRDTQASSQDVCEKSREEFATEGSDKDIVKLSLKDTSMHDHDHDTPASGQKSETSNKKRSKFSQQVLSNIKKVQEQQGSLKDIKKQQKDDKNVTSNIRNAPVSTVPAVPQKVLSPLDTVCSILSQWRTPETVQYLTGGDTGESIVSRADFQQKYNALGKIAEFREQVRDKAEAALEESSALKESSRDSKQQATKALPDLQTLEKDRVAYELKMREYYKGNFYSLEDTLGQEESGAVSEKDVYDPILPPVDTYSQVSIRRKIVLDKLNRALNDLRGPLGFVIGELSTPIRQLVATFSLTNMNITLKPAQWTLMALVLLYLLSLKDDHIKATLDYAASKTFLPTYLTTLGITQQQLHNIAESMATVS